MLAQNFKTAADLELEEEDHRALVAALGVFERGEVSHADSGLPCNKPRKPNKQFNMSLWHSRNEYGTVCCIGGTAELLGGKNLHLYGSGHRIDKLFFPPLNIPWEKITVEQAACALRNYLTIGEPMWSEVCGRG